MKLMNLPECEIFEIILRGYLVLTHPLCFRLFGFNGGKLRMDERIDLSMSDPDLVPLLIQVFFLFTYIYCP